MTFVTLSVFFFVRVFDLRSIAIQYLISQLIVRQRARRRSRIRQDRFAEGRRFAQADAAPWRLYFLSGIAVATLVVLTVIAYRERPARALVLLPLGLVGGGAAGNLIDRLTSGMVVDFIDFSVHTFHWPVFNVADSAVVIGVLWILWLSFRGKPGSPRTA